jgi:hypothetical protein
MNLQHVNIKVFVDGESNVDKEQVIKLFHQWVADQAMDEMLIDVADYSHVPAGPGVVAVGLQADYALDNAGNRLGLLYNRKASLDGSNEDRIRSAVQAASKACSLLEAAFDGLKFSRQEFEIIINDRALAPNNEETFEACQAELPGILASVLGTSDMQLDYNRDPRSRFGATVRLAAPTDALGA